ncbi:MAG: hypothetical protein ACLQF0_04370 [Dissulfurispiraceae bacterium]
MKDKFIDELSKEMPEGSILPVISSFACSEKGILLINKRGELMFAPFFGDSSPDVSYNSVVSGSTGAGMSFLSRGDKIDYGQSCQRIHLEALVSSALASIGHKKLRVSDYTRGLFLHERKATGKLIDE